MTNRDREPHGRRMRLLLVQPNGLALDPVGEFPPQFNADAASPLTVQVQVQCPTCGCWAKVLDQPIPNWGPDYA